MSLNRYTPEFKRKVIDLHKKCGRTYKSIADEYGVSKASRTRLDRPFRLVYKFRYIPLRRSHTPAAAISRSSVSRSRVTIKSSGK